MHPEQDVIVTLSEQGVSCAHPGGSIEFVGWDELRAVIIQTTSEGPFLPDVFWVLVGERGGCVVPQGATGERELFERLQRLQDFDNDAVLSAMRCTENRRFLCWQKTTLSEYPPLELR